jgi:hypothetical protein
MTNFLCVLPQRDEIGVTLTKGNFVDISQVNSSTSESDTIRIHVDDIPGLIEALSGAIQAAKTPVEIPF